MERREDGVPREKPSPEEGITGVTWLIFSVTVVGGGVCKGYRSKGSGSPLRSLGWERIRS